jgi:hypothetical protein
VAIVLGWLEAFGEMSKPYPDRSDGGGRREVETFDVAPAQRAIRQPESTLSCPPRSGL